MVALLTHAIATLSPTAFHTLLLPGLDVVGCKFFLIGLKGLW